MQMPGTNRQAGIQDSNAKGPEIMNHLVLNTWCAQGKPGGPRHEWPWHRWDKDKGIVAPNIFGPTLRAQTDALVGLVA